MWLVQTVIQEKRLIFVLSHEFFCLFEKQSGHIFILPLRRLSSFLETDTRYAVHDGTGMSDTGMHTQQFRVILTGRLAIEVFPIIDIQRIGRIQPYPDSVFNKNTRDTVICRSLDKRIIIPDLFSSRRNGIIPIHCSVSQS